MKRIILKGLVLSTVLASSLFAVDTLDNMVITTKTNSSSTLDAPGSVSIITQEDIKTMNANSIKEVIEEISGVTTSINDSSLNGRQTISIRGTESKHSIILIDGKKVSGTDAQIGHSNFQYNWIPLSAIKKIEVVKGPMSALYGSRGVGGVINIITKKPENKFNGEVDIKGGKGAEEGAKEQDVSLTLSGEVTQNLSVALFLQKNKQNVTSEVVAGDKVTSQEGQDVENLMLNAWYDIDDTQQISASYLDSNEIRETLTYKEYYKIDKDHYSLGYKKNFEDVSFDLKYYITESDSHTNEFEYTHKLKDKTLNAEVAIASFDKNYIVVGLEHKKEYYRKQYDALADDATKGFNDSINYNSAYIQDEIELNEDLILTIGTRYDKHENFGSALSPKANIVYKLSKNSRLKAGYGQGFNAPTLTENSAAYSVAIPTEFYPAGLPFNGMPKTFHRFTGNDDLKAEESKSFELGYEYEDNGLVYKTTIFHTEIDNMITQSYQGDTVVGPMTYKEYLYDNVENAQIDGLELEYSQKELIKNIDLKVGYTFLKTENKSTGEELTSKPKHNINIRTTAKLPYDIHSTFRTTYVGEQLNGEGNETGGYTTFAIQFSKEFIKDFTARVGVENLTNKELSDSSSNYDLEGRLVYIGLNYKF